MTDTPRLDAKRVYTPHEALCILAAARSAEYLAHWARLRGVKPTYDESVCRQFVEDALELIARRVPEREKAG